ncbi:MAG: choice-of-anchor J domain-containing protein [Bacteroidales bacterium]
MKKIILACFFSLCEFMMIDIYAQDILFEDFQSITLDNKGIGDIPSSYLLYNDSNTPYYYSIIDYTYMDKAWKVLKDKDGNKFAQSISYFKKAAQADRWMITPEIDLTKAKNPLFLFNARSGDITKKETYQVRISLSGTNKEDFTILLKEIKEEEVNWTEHSFWLEEYKGKKIHLAFVENSKDKLLVQVDNIRVTDFTNQSTITLSPLLLSTTFDYTDTKGVPIECKIRNMGQDTITNYTMNYSINNGDVQSQGVSNTEIYPLKTEITKNLVWHPSQKGYYSIRFWISKINGSTHNSDTIEHTLFVINEKLLPPTISLYEGFTSKTCSPCMASKPYVSEMLHHLQANKPGSKIAATIYQMNVPVPGDPCFLPLCSSRFFAYNLSGVPSFVVNGTVQKFKLWTDITTKIPTMVEEAYTKGAPMSVSYSIKRKGQTFTIYSEFVNHKPIEGDLRYFIVFVEDSILHESDTDPKKAYFNVVRMVLPSIAGGVIEAKNPGDITLKTDSCTFNGTDPKIFTTLDKMSVIVFVQDMRTKQILQVCMEPSDHVAVETESPKDNTICKLYPNPASNMVNLSFTLHSASSIKIQIVDMSGLCLYHSSEKKYTAGEHEVLINTQNFKPGLYFVKMEGIDVVLKLIVKA